MSIIQGSVCFVLFKDFIYVFMRDRERERERERGRDTGRGRGSLQGAQWGTQPQDPRITP